MTAEKLKQYFFIYPYERKIFHTREKLFLRQDNE